MAPLGARPLPWTRGSSPRETAWGWQASYALRRSWVTGRRRQIPQQNWGRLGPARPASMRQNWSYQLAWPPKEKERGERESRAGLPLILARQTGTESIHGTARKARHGLHLRINQYLAGYPPHPHLHD